MSAASLVLPLVWAMVYADSEPAFESCRNGPHSLKLVAPEPQSLEPQPQLAQPPPPLPEPVPFVAPNMAFYRKYTEALLHRFASMSLEAGRVPSLMGRELFRGDVSHCKVNGFDDVVHFVYDVGNCLKLLTAGQQYLLRRIALHGYTQSDTAALLGISLRTVIRRYSRALDRLTALLIERELLRPDILPAKQPVENSSLELLSIGSPGN